MATTNYTPEQSADLVREYQAGATLTELEAKTGRSTKSIIAKLVKEGVYTSIKTEKPKQLKKAELVALIAAELDIDPAIVASLEKATHEALDAVWKAVEMALDHGIYGT